MKCSNCPKGVPCGPEGDIVCRSPRACHDAEYYSSVNWFGGTRALDSPLYCIPPWSWLIYFPTDQNPSTSTSVTIQISFILIANSVKARDPIGSKNTNTSLQCSFVDCWTHSRLYAHGKIVTFYIRLCLFVLIFIFYIQCSKKWEKLIYNLCYANVCPTPQLMNSKIKS